MIFKVTGTLILLS
jgi:hypothetical protein